MNTAFTTTCIDPSPGPRPGYRCTQLGDIPEDWAVDSLIKSWDVIDCKHVTAKFVFSGVPVASIQEVQNRFVDLRHAKQTTDDFYRLLIYGGRKPQPGDLILSRNATVGEIAQVAPWHPNFAMGQDVCLLRKRTQFQSTDFLQSVFRSDIVARQLENLMTGSTFRRVNVKQVKSLLVPTPPTVEQRAIAGALSDVDELIGTLDKLIAKKRAIKLAAMQQLLTGKTRLPGFNEEWREDRIDSQASIRTGGRNTQDRIKDGLYPFFVRSQQVERIDSYSYEGEAVLTAGDGVGTGKVFHYINGRFDVHQRVYRIYDFSEELNGRYFYYQFSTRFFDRIMSLTAKSSVDSVRMEMIAGMKIPLPSREEQDAIATVLSDMDAEIAALEQRRDKTKAIKQGMMQVLLTGKTRLVSSGKLKIESGK